MTTAANIRAVLLRDILGLLASYSWAAGVELTPTAIIGAEDEGETPEEFLRELRMRHALAAGQLLLSVIVAIERRPSYSSGVHRTETEGTIRGRLDIPRYIAQRSRVRSFPRPFPVIQSKRTFETPENVLALAALRDVRTAVKDNPFPPKSAESALADSLLHWAHRKLGGPPWNEVPLRRWSERFLNDVEARVRRRQTGNEFAYSELLTWFSVWNLDLARLPDDVVDRIVEGILAYPSGEGFWNRVFEVWCLYFLVESAKQLGWHVLDGPAALHTRKRPIYRFQTPDRRTARVWFQSGEFLPPATWHYAKGGALRGIPDLVLDLEDGTASPLLVDAKNRFITGGPPVRPEETYKMLGYAENFFPASWRPFHGLLLFPGDQSASRTLEGPSRSRLRVVSVDVESDRLEASSAVQQALLDWSHQWVT